MTQLLLDEHPLLILPGLARAVGLNEAIVLQQLHYWLQKSQHEHDGRRWIYNTYSDWQEQFPFWSVATIRRTLTSLREPYTPKKGSGGRVPREALVLAGRFNRLGMDKTNWYTILYDNFPITKTVSRPLPETTQRLAPEKKHGHM